MPLGRLLDKRDRWKDDSPLNFCDKYDLLIKIYGRMILYKPAFCYDCTNLYNKNKTKTKQQ